MIKNLPTILAASWFVRKYSKKNLRPPPPGWTKATLKIWAWKTWWDLELSWVVWSMPGGRFPTIIPMTSRWGRKNYPDIIHRYPSFIEVQQVQILILSSNHIESYWIHLNPWKSPNLSPFSPAALQAVAAEEVVATGQLETVLREHRQVKLPMCSSLWLEFTYNGSEQPCFCLQIMATVYAFPHQWSSADGWLKTWSNVVCPLNP